MAGTFSYTEDVDPLLPSNSTQFKSWQTATETTQLAKAQAKGFSFTKTTRTVSTTYIIGSLVQPDPIDPVAQLWSPKTSATASGATVARVTLTWTIV